MDITIDRDMEERDISSRGRERRKRVFYSPTGEEERQRVLSRALQTSQSSPITRGLLARLSPSLEEGSEVQESEEENDAHPSPPLLEEADEQDADTPDSLQSVSLLAGVGEEEGYQSPPFNNTEEEYIDEEEDFETPRRSAGARRRTVLIEREQKEEQDPHIQQEQEENETENDNTTDDDDDVEGEGEHSPTLAPAAVQPLPDEEGKPTSNGDDDVDGEEQHSLTDTEDEEEAEDEDTDDDDTEEFTTFAGTISLDPLGQQEDVTGEGEVNEQQVKDDDEGTPRLLLSGEESGDDGVDEDDDEELLKSTSKRFSTPSPPHPVSTVSSHLHRSGEDQGAVVELEEEPMEDVNMGEGEQEQGEEEQQEQGDQKQQEQGDQEQQEQGDQEQQEQGEQEQEEAEAEAFSPPPHGLQPSSAASPAHTLASTPVLSPTSGPSPVLTHTLGEGYTEKQLLPGCSHWDTGQVQEVGRLQREQEQQEQQEQLPSTHLSPERRRPHWIQRQLDVALARAREREVDGDASSPPAPTPAAPPMSAPTPATSNWRDRRVAWGRFFFMRKAAARPDRGQQQQRGQQGPGRQMPGQQVSGQQQPGQQVPGQQPPGQQVPGRQVPGQQQLDQQVSGQQVPGQDVSGEAPGPSQEATQLPPLPWDLPTMEEAHRTHIPTYIHPPKAARSEFTRQLTEVWRQIHTTPDDARVWILEYMFCRAILPAGRGPRQGDSYSQAKQVKDRLRRWGRGEYRALWDEAVQLTKVPPRARRQRRRTGEPEVVEKAQVEKNAERAAKLAQEGQYTRGLQTLTSHGMADNSRATVEQMRAKHPQADQAAPFQPTSTAQQISFSQKDVHQAAKSFRRGSAPGPSGLRPEHLKVALKAPSPSKADKALQALTKVVNLMVAGLVPPEVAPYLCGARLHAAKKKDGGIRPIAVGNLLRRLTSKLVAKEVALKAAGLLSPHQMGFGVRGGCEAIVHTVRQVVEQGDPDKWVLQVDLKNAFNLANRETTFPEAEQLFPELLSWTLTCYGAASELVLGDTTIPSSMGFHQGDPLAGLLFSINLHPVVKMIQEEVPDLDVSTWYLDDGTLVGTREQLQKAVDVLLREGPSRGLHLSTAATVPMGSRPKSTVWCPNSLHSEDSQDPLDRGIPRVQEAGIVLLGAPLGSHQFEQEKINLKVEKIREITEHLFLLNDPHTEFALLRSCLSLPKIMFTLRTTDTSRHQQEIQEFDLLTREAFTRILGAPLTDLEWAQAKLPVSMGGMGLRAAEDHGAAAYASSYLSSLPLSREIRSTAEEDSPAFLPPALLQLLSTQQGENTTVESLEGVPQKTISYKIDLYNQTALTNHFTGAGEQREIARLASLGLPHAGDWLNVVPSPALGLHMRSMEFVTATKYRLGMNIYSRAGPCPACSNHSDQLGDHSLCCGSRGERSSRHNILRDILYKAAVSAALGPTREERGLIPGSDRRPGDIFIPYWTGGKGTALDVTVTNPLQIATVAQASITAGHALTVAYNRKMRDAAEVCRRQGITFLPLAAESLGGWHPVAEEQVRKLAGAISRHTGQELEEAQRHLWQSLSVHLMKGNAALLANRIPDEEV